MKTSIVIAGGDWEDASKELWTGEFPGPMLNASSFVVVYGDEGPTKYRITMTTFVIGRDGAAQMVYYVATTAEPLNG